MSAGQQTGTFRATTFAVCCRWADRSRALEVSGCEAIVVKAHDANDAQLRAHALRPDLWEPRPGLYRETAVYPVRTIADAQR